MKQAHKDSMWLYFRIDDMDCCILSDYIESIVIPTERIDSIPQSSSILAGVSLQGNDSIHIIDMRRVFGKMDLKKCIEEFSIMKEMHMSWIKDLQRYVSKGGEFNKPVDPHKCKFGLWRDNFSTDNARLIRLLKKIDEPHRNIHFYGAKIMALKKQEGDHREEIANILTEAELLCNEDMIPLLDRLIDIYSSANRGVLLVIENENYNVGFLVDEVKSLIPCSKAQIKKLNSNMERSSFLGDIVMLDKKVMLEVNVEEILSKM